MIYFKIQNVLGVPFFIRTSDKWYNATEFCERHNTTFQKWQTSQIGNEFINYVLSTSDYRLSDLIDKSQNEHFVSPVLIVGLAVSLSNYFAWQVTQQGVKNTADQNSSMDFTYTVDRAKSGRWKQTVTFYPIINLHMPKDVKHERSIALKEARLVDMEFQSKVVWVPMPE